MKLVRSGNTFAGFSSPDGNTWTQVGATVTIAMSANALVGLAVTAHNNTALNTSTFDNVSLTAGTATTAAPSSATVARDALITSPLEWSGGSTSSISATNNDDSAWKLLYPLAVR